MRQELKASAIRLSGCVGENMPRTTCQLKLGTNGGGGAGGDEADGFHYIVDVD